MAFGLELQRLPQPELKRRVAATLARVGLEGLPPAHRGAFPAVNANELAWAGSWRPPAAAAAAGPWGPDRALRERLMADLQLILKQVGVTSIMVTHDQAEAFAVADTVAVIHDGQLAQIAPPETLYRRPASPLVARFIGLHNLGRGPGWGRRCGWNPPGPFSERPPCAARRLPFISVKAVS